MSKQILTINAKNEPTFSDLWHLQIAYKISKVHNYLKIIRKYSYGKPI
jgi:hypothetical protein